MILIKLLDFYLKANVYQNVNWNKGELNVLHHENNKSTKSKKTNLNYGLPHEIFFQWYIVAEQLLHSATQFTPGDQCFELVAHLTVLLLILCSCVNVSLVSQIFSTSQISKCRDDSEALKIQHGTHKNYETCLNVYLDSPFDKSEEKLRSGIEKRYFC